MSKETISYTNAKLGPLPTKAATIPDNILDAFSLKGKVASVTGSSGGIGWAVAEGYAQAGADVAIWYNSHPADDKAEYLTKTYGVKSKAYKCNVTDFQDVEKLSNKLNWISVPLISLLPMLVLPGPKGPKSMSRSRQMEQSC